MTQRGEAVQARRIEIEQNHAGSRLSRETILAGKILCQLPAVFDKIEGRADAVLTKGVLKQGTVGRILLCDQDRICGI